VVPRLDLRILNDLGVIVIDEAKPQCANETHGSDETARSCPKKLAALAIQSVACASPRFLVSLRWSSFSFA
jgi:hypothetical protein